MGDSECRNRRSATGNHNLLRRNGCARRGGLLPHFANSCYLKVAVRRCAFCAFFSPWKRGAFEKSTAGAPASYVALL